MRKWKVFVGIISVIIFCSITLSVKKVLAETYLESDKNFYTDTTIKKGFLDQEISESIIGTKNWEMFQRAISKKLIIYEPGMTFNQYYLANGISPEDNFTVYPKLSNQLIKLPSGAYLNANNNPKGATDSDGNTVDYITYVGPTDDRGAYWGDKELEDPVLFSRLTVGELPSASEGTLGLFNSGTYLFPTQIGYGENATVNDYMLTPGNDFIIPTRFNTIRNDVYLTMRSRAYFGAGLQGAQASLTATSNGKTVVGSSENSKFYIDTNSNVYLTKQGFDQLGNFGKFMAPSVYTSASNNLKKVGIDKFSAMMNKGLSSIQSNSGASTIVSGNGGQIQLSGFNRETDLDGAFSSSISDRENDALKNTDVNFYMYTNGNTETNVTTPLAPNGYHLYSPNVSEFKIQTTRPYFSWTGDISNAIKISEANADFDDLLGSNSLQVTDNGVDSDGKSISVDLNRVRIRISEDEGSTYSSNSYTLDELKTLLTSGNITIPKIVIAYTYSATDSKTDNIGKLPNEIDDNTGAYAVPFTRTLTNDVPDKKSSITVNYVDTSGNTISDNVVKSGNVGEDYTTEQKTIPGYSFKEIQGPAFGQFTSQEQTVTYVYTKDPVVGGNVIAKYVDAAGNTISDNVVK
ncbi:MAG: MucBP domain-containing protein, partial [Blautia wexlerae]